MNHQNFQEAIEQLSANEGMNSEQVKGKFNLSQEDMIAMQSNNSHIQAVKPQPISYCCCCCA